MAQAKGDELLGFSRTECGVDCTPERCAITHEACCAHPLKGGLQNKYQINDEVKARYNKVRRILLRQQMEMQERRAEI